MMNQKLEKMENGNGVRNYRLECLKLVVGNGGVAKSEETIQKAKDLEGYINGGIDVNSFGKILDGKIDSLQQRATGVGNRDGYDKYEFTRNILIELRKHL